MRNSILIASILLLIFSCKDDTEVEFNTLAEYIELNNTLEVADLVACAGGKEDGFLGSAAEPTDVMFYPITGATDFQYFEAASVADSVDFSKYIPKELSREPLFNGYLQKFNNEPFDGETMGIVTYKTPGKIHICNAIREKTNIKPTEVNSTALTINENGVTPSFSWSDGLIDENVIYFHVISDADNNLISGTYTFDKNFTFYDLSNVVFNITDPNVTPTLESNKTYTFTLMGVSEDNWVNFFLQEEFRTD